MSEMMDDQIIDNIRERTRNVIRVPNFVAGWSPGESHRGIAEITVIGLDINGMTLRVDNFSPSSEPDKQQGEPVAVAPSPS